MHKNEKRNLIMDAVTGIDDEILNSTLKKRFELWFKRGKRSKKQLISFIAAAACLCILATVLFVFLDTVPVYQGMTISSSEPSLPADSSVASLPSAIPLSASAMESTMPLSVKTGSLSLPMSADPSFGIMPLDKSEKENEDKDKNTDKDNSLPVFGETYYAMPGEDIYIHIHISNPAGYEILSFTLNGVKYSSYMFEVGSDLETLILKYNVGDVSGPQEYTIDAIKYVDGEKIKDVRMKGDKTVQVFVNGGDFALQLQAEVVFDTLTLSTAWAPTFTGEKTILSLGLYEDNILYKELSPTDTVITGLPLGKRFVLKATYLEGNTEQTVSYVFATPKPSEGLLISDGIIRGIGTCPDTVLYLDAPIAPGAFQGNTFIKEVHLSSNVASVPENAFADNTALTKVVLSNGITSIGNYAFAGCGSLTDATIPESIKSIGEGAFSGCRRLGEITLPDNLTKISKATFSGCMTLKSIVLPNNITSIGDSAFNGCTKLEHIVIPDKVKGIEDGAFSSCSRLVEIDLPDNLTKIGTSAFYGCAALKSIVLPNTVTKLNPHTFAYCSALTQITLPESIISIGDYAFISCTSLETIHLPKELTNIGSSAFSDCLALQSIVIPDGVTHLDCTFHGCKALKNIILPEKAIRINDAFSDTGYYNNSQNWENGILYIGRHLIAAKESVTVCTIKPQTLTVANHTFICASKLKEISFSEGLLILGNGAFWGCTSLEKVTLPASLTKVGVDAFYDTAATIYYSGTMAKWKSIKDIDYNSNYYLVVCTDGTIKARSK